MNQIFDVGVQSLTQNELYRDEIGIGDKFIASFLIKTW